MRDDAAFDRAPGASYFPSATTEELGRRLMLWEISGNMHCSIVGTCLDRADVARLMRKAGTTRVAGSTDYEVHSWLVGQIIKPGRPRACPAAATGRRHARARRQGRPLARGAAAPGALGPRPAPRRRGRERAAAPPARPFDRGARGLAAAPARGCRGAHRRHRRADARMALCRRPSQQPAASPPLRRALPRGAPVPRRRHRADAAWARRSRRPGGDGVLPGRLHQPRRLPARKAALPPAGQAVRAAAQRQQQPFQAVIDRVGFAPSPSPPVIAPSSHQ
jgi:hypothetical protein